MILSGVKRQTIRATPKRMPQPGDILDARSWSGKAYRSQHKHLGSFTISSVEAVSIFYDSIAFGDGRFITGGGLTIEARKDGFFDWDTMSLWFQNTTGLPLLNAIVITWSFEHGRF